MRGSHKDHVGKVGSRFVPIRDAISDPRQWVGVWAYRKADLCSLFRVSDPGDVEINDNSTALTQLAELRPLCIKINAANPATVLTSSGEITASKLIYLHRLIA